MRATLRDIYQRRDAAARAWTATGGRVVGYIGEGVPPELIAAAGFLPYRLSGDPDLPLTNVRRHLHASFNKGQSERPIRLAWVDAIIEKLLNGSYDFIEFLIVPYTRKEVAQVYGKLRDIARDHPQFRLPETYLLDRAILGGAAGEAYNTARLAELGQQLVLWGGAPITDATLASAISEANRGRNLLNQMQGLRGRTLTGADALAMIGASQVMPRADHNALLESTLGEPGSVTGKRIFVCGSATDNDALYRAIEATGAVVVGESHDWGIRLAENPVEESGDPFSALAARTHRVSPVLTYPLSRSVARCVERAQDCGAEAAVFWVTADDSYQMFETPDERAALAAVGIPSMYLSEQPYRIDSEEVTAQVRAFVETLA